MSQPADANWIATAHLRRQPGESEAEFVDRRLDEARVRHEATLARMEAYRVKNGGFDPSGTSAGSGNPDTCRWGPFG